MDNFKEKYDTLVRKYDSLLAENEELKSILQQYGITYSTQNRMDVESVFSSITFPSVCLSLDEKIELFHSYFKGREDVFARRWFSRTTQKEATNLFVLTNGVEEFVIRRNTNVQIAPTETSLH